MSSPRLNPPEILPFRSGIPENNPKSGILAQSGIWVFPFPVSGLYVSLRISDAALRNLGEILNIALVTEAYAGFQISEKPPLKGWVDSPRKAGRSTTHPWAISQTPFWGKRSSDDGDPLRQEHDRRRLPPEQPTTKETTHG